MSKLKVIYRKVLDAIKGKFTKVKGRFDLGKEITKCSHCDGNSISKAGDHVYCNDCGVILK